MNKTYERLMEKNMPEIKHVIVPNPGGPTVCPDCGQSPIFPPDHTQSECTKRQIDALRKELLHPVVLPEKVLSEGEILCPFLWSNRHPGFMRCRLFAGHTCDHEAMDFSGRYRCTWSGKQDEEGKEELIK